MKSKSILVFMMLIGISAVCRGKVVVDNMFSSDMVVQRNTAIRIWGSADRNEKVKVSFAGRHGSAVADADGKWEVRLKALPASSVPRTMQISGTRNSITLKNILVGDVWIASGQSNMQYSMTEKMPQPMDADSLRMKRDYETANDRLVRVMLVRKELSTATLPTDGWHGVNRESLKDFSAVAYYFAKNLADSLNVPVGIVASSWGGSPIESWIPQEVYEHSPYYNDERNNWRYNKCELGEKFRHMILPITKMPISGFIWYQGEANLSWHETDIYGEKLQSLISSWRRVWGDDSLPFYYVQITPYSYSTGRYRRFPLTWDMEAEFWKAQQSCLKLANTGMAYTTDLTDNVDYLHPSYKWKVGERLARIALNRHYGWGKVVCEGPTFLAMQVDRATNTITISFCHTDGGLRTRDGKMPDSFCVRDRKERFAPVLSTRIDGNNVILTCKSISENAAVRFGWDEADTPNLENGYGLPAVVFMEEGK